MINLKLLNFENVSEEEVNTYRVREAARAIVLDKEDKIALIYSTNNEYYKLPGGGVEKDENYKEALRRECLEEIGCDIEIINELGSIVEYRKEEKLNQISYCYITKIVGEKGKPKFDDNEIKQKFEPVWMSIEEALKRMYKTKTQVYQSSYMLTRDITFLTEAKKLLI